MIRTSSIFVVCALALGCSDSDDAATAPDDTGTVADDTGTTGDDTGTSMTDTGTADDSSMSDGTSSETSTETGGETGGETGTGPSCSDYCSKVTANCTGDTNAQYVNTGGKAPAEVCALMCAKMTPGAAADMTGDTVGCRTSFATAAAASDPGANCRKAGAYGGGTCGADRCSDFCKLALAQCPTAFTNEMQCKAKCAAMAFDATKPEVDPTAVGKLNCVLYHLEAAYVAPSSHCGHLTVTTAGTPCTPP
jgi:hypothetical protein